MGRPTKQFKRFAASGKLTETIKNRRSQREKTKKFEGQVEQRKRQRGSARAEDEVSDDEDESADEGSSKKDKFARGGKVGGVTRTVDELFGAGGLDVPVEEGSDLEELSEGDEDEDEDDDEDMEDDDEDMDEEAMERAMAELEKKDPEFFKHLKAEDPSLLQFSKGKGRAADDDDEDMDEDEDDEDDDMMDEDTDEAAPVKIVVTMKMLRGWREGMLKVSLIAQAFH
jgi:nucleolar complex protein 2